MKRVFCFLIIGLVITGLADAANRETGVTEKGGILKMLSVPLKGGGHADIRFEKLIRSYYAGWRGWFQGAGGHPEAEE